MDMEVSSIEQTRVDDLNEDRSPETIQWRVLPGFRSEESRDAVGVIIVVHDELIGRYLVLPGAERELDEGRESFPALIISSVLWQTVDWQGDFRKIWEDGGEEEEERSEETVTTDASVGWKHGEEQRRHECCGCCWLVSPR